MSDIFKDTELSEQPEINPDAGEQISLSELTQKLFNQAESGLLDYLDSLNDNDLAELDELYPIDTEHAEPVNRAVINIYGDDYNSPFIGLSAFDYDEVAEISNNDFAKIIRNDIIAAIAQYEGTKDTEILSRYTKVLYPLITNKMLPKYNEVINTTKTGQPKKRQKVYTYESFIKSITVDEIHDLFKLYTKDIRKQYFHFIDACNAHNIAEESRAAEEENREPKPIEYMTDSKEFFTTYLSTAVDVPYFGYKAFNFDIADYERLLQQEIDKYYSDAVNEGEPTKAIKATPQNKLTIQHNNNTIINLNYPLDKINADIWNMFSDVMPTGQLTYAVERKGDSRQANIIFAINFDAMEELEGLTVTLKLTPYDKRLYIATAALFNSGYNCFTISQIYKTMGFDGRPNGREIKRINDALTKMTLARIYLDNTHEASVYTSRTKFKYDGSLLPMERVTAEVNGQITEQAIHLLREPPMLTFAKQRKQVTTIPPRLFLSPVNKTDTNLRIEDYLIDRIAHIKKGNLNNKILFSTIFSRANVTEKKQKQRAKDTVTKFLEHYKAENYIKDFKIDKDSVTIYY